MSWSSIDFTAAADWLCTFALHSTLLLAIAWLVGVGLRHRELAFQEGFLRFSLWGALVSSTAQYFVFSSMLPWAIELPNAANAVAVLVPDALPAPAGFELTPLGEPAPFRVSQPWPTIVVGVAGMLAVLGFCWLGLVYRGLSRVLTLRTPEVDPRLLTTAAQVAHELGLRQSPHVSRCALIATPIAFGWMRPEICLPGRAARLGDASLRAMLAHEIAHLRRGDPAWMWLAAFLQALFPWQLLLLLVRRRWARLVELRCDALAARHSSPTAVARCLLDVAEWLRPDAPTSLVALGMAARPSSLRERIEAALHPQPALARHPLAFRAFGGLSLSALTLIAPGVQTGDGHDLALSPHALTTKALADDAIAAPASAGEHAAAMAAAMELLQTEHAGLVAEAARLRSDLRVRVQSPLIEQMLTALDRRLLSLERLRARLQARLDRRSTDPR